MNYGSSKDSNGRGNGSSPNYTKGSPNSHNNSYGKGYDSYKDSYSFSKNNNSSPYAGYQDEGKGYQSGAGQGGGHGGGNTGKGGQYTSMTPAQQACTRMGHMTRQVGKIRMYNPTKGWGFVLADESLVQYGVNADIFLHSKHFENAQDLPQVFIGHDNSQKMGALQVWVSYNLDLSEEKKPQALMVRIEQHDPGVLLGPKPDNMVVAKGGGKVTTGGKPVQGNGLPMGSSSISGSGSMEFGKMGKDNRKGGLKNGNGKANGSNFSGSNAGKGGSPGVLPAPPHAPAQPSTSSKNKGGFTGREAYAHQNSGPLYPQNSAGSSHDENVKMRISFMNTPTNRRNTFLGEDLDLSGLVNNGGVNMVLTPPMTCIDDSDSRLNTRKRDPSACGSPRGDTTPLPFPDFGHTPMNDDFAGFHPGFFYSTFKMPTFEQVMEKVAENDKSNGGNSPTTSRQRSTGGKLERESSEANQGSQTTRSLREQKDVQRMRSNGSVGAPVRSTSNAKNAKQMLALGSEANHSTDIDDSPSKKELRNESSQSFTDFLKGKRLDGSPRSPAPPGLEHIRPSFGFGSDEKIENSNNNDGTGKAKVLNSTPNSSASTRMPDTPGKKKSKNLENSNEKLEGDKA